MRYARSDAFRHPAARASANVRASVNASRTGRHIRRGLRAARGVSRRPSTRRSLMFHLSYSIHRFSMFHVPLGLSTRRADAALRSRRPLRTAITSRGRLASALAGTRWRGLAEAHRRGPTRLLSAEVRQTLVRPSLRSPDSLFMLPKRAHSAIDQATRQPATSNI